MSFIVKIANEFLENKPNYNSNTLTVPIGKINDRNVIHDKTNSIYVLLHEMDILEDDLTRKLIMLTRVYHSYIRL